jgi:cellulose synthase operon protein YhjQ
MDHVIALEWGRFSGETEAIPAENRKTRSKAESESGEGFEEDPRQSALRLLESALALPPDPGMSLYDESMTLPGVTVSSLASQEGSASPEPSPADRNPGRALESAPEKESGKYQNRLMWTGTGFEERPVLIVPDKVIDAPESKPAPVLEETAVEPILENTDTLSSLSSTPSATAAVAAELPSEAGDERISAHEPPVLLSEPSLLAEARQLTPLAETASTLEPSNGSKIAQGTSSSDDSRWYMLSGVLSGAPAPEELPAPVGNVPVLAVFSLAGGVGKTSLVAALGRALAARGERVLLVEATPFGSLPYYFGTCDCRPGTLRTFRPPASSSDLPILLASVDPESLLGESAEQGALAAEIEGWADGASRVIVDVATASAATARALLALSPTVLVPLIPDVSSVVAANTIDSFFQRQANAPGAEPEVYYLLNQFDPSLSLHLEVAKVLRDGLGERLLPFVLERDATVSEALADGMTVIDYSPGSTMAEIYTRLAEWVDHAMAPAQISSRGARWSEQ